MADRFQKEISSVMRGDNNPSVYEFIHSLTPAENFPLQNHPGVFVPDKLTGLLPVLSPGAQGAPLPKVAAHVTGMAPFTGPPAADGEGPLKS